MASSDIALAALGHDPNDLVQAPPEVIAETIRGYQTHPVHFLRDIFGNPFRPVCIAPAWLAWNDGLVVTLAQAAYDNRQLPSGHLDPGRLPVLADALEEAGGDGELLEHLRGPGPHWRGCWCVDSLTGRE